METYSIVWPKECIVFGVPKDISPSNCKIKMHTDTFQPILLQDLIFKQGCLALLSQEMSCQKAISDHILTPGLLFECLKERPDEASATPFRALLPLCIGVAINHLLYSFNLQPKPCSVVNIMSDSRHSGAYFKMSGFCMYLNATLKIFCEPAEPCMLASLSSICSAHVV